MRFFLSGKRGFFTGENPATVTFEGANGSTFAIKSKMVDHTLSTGGTTSTVSGLFTDGMLVLAVVARTLKAITTGGDRTTIALSDGAANWFSKATLTVGTTYTQADATGIAYPKIYAAAADGTLTVSGGSSGNITAGEMRIVVYYVDVVAPTV
jgi:hypothetical protein